jgi:hypothetical protein
MAGLMVGQDAWTAPRDQENRQAGVSPAYGAGFCVLAAASKTRRTQSDLVSSALLAASSISVTSEGSTLKINRPALEVPFGIGGRPRFLRLVVMG